MRQSSNTRLTALPGLGSETDPLFRLNIWVAARTSWRRDNRRLAGLGRWSFHPRIDLRRTDHAARLSEFLAQCLIAALLLSTGF